MNSNLEWSNAFDLQYDNANKSAPHLNSYEKSVYLTQAQIEIVKELYSGKNQFQEGFENSEYIRRSLDALVCRSPMLYPSSNFNTLKLSQKNDIIEIPEYPDGVNKFWLLLNERVTYKSDDECIKNLDDIKVIPISHDEYNIIIRDPYKRPNKRKVLRLDLSKNNTRLVELVTKFKIKDYQITYLREPSPIILDDISNSNPEYDGLDLTINGLDSVTNCELSSIVHNIILNRAVELAVRDYKENTLGNQIQTNIRNF